MNLKEVLGRAQWSTITAAELDEVVGRISRGGSGDLHTLLHILGRAGSSRYRTLMEEYLRYSKDPPIAALALKVLFRWWGLADNYRNEVISSLQGFDWDPDEYVKLQAISLAGEYLRNHQNREMLEIIYRIFADNAERPLMRSAAYCALCRAHGAEWRDLPPASRVMDLATEVNHQLVARIEQYLRESSG